MPANLCPGSDIIAPSYRQPLSGWHLGWHAIVAGLKRTNGSGRLVGDCKLLFLG
jgi:hypothetical protein